MFKAENTLHIIHVYMYQGNRSIYKWDIMNLHEWDLSLMPLKYQVVKHIFTISNKVCTHFIYIYKKTSIWIFSSTKALSNIKKP